MNLQTFKQARRYAQAFLNVFAQNPSPELLQNLENLLDFLNTNPRIFTKLSSLITDETVKTDALSMLTEHFNLKNPGKQLILVLVKDRTIKLLPLIVTLLISEARSRRHEFLCEVATSHNLSQTAKESLCRALTAQLGGTVLATYRQDASLIQGIRITGKTFLWENSIAKKLKQAMAFIALQE